MTQVANHNITLDQQGDWVHFQYTPNSLANKLEFIMSGSGDADLYIKANQQPTLSNWDFRPFLSSSFESVIINENSTPTFNAQNTYHYSVRAYNAPVTFNLIVKEYTAQVGDYQLIGTLPFQLIPTHWAYTTLNTASDFAQLKLDLTGIGDADLYISKFGFPTTQSYSIRSIGPTSKETIEIGYDWLLPVGSTTFIGVYGYSQCAGSLTGYVKKFV